MTKKKKSKIVATKHWCCHKTCLVSLSPWSNTFAAKIWKWVRHKHDIKAILAIYVLQHQISLFVRGVKSPCFVSINKSIATMSACNWQHELMSCFIFSFILWPSFTQYHKHPKCADSIRQLYPHCFIIHSHVTVINFLKFFIYCFILIFMIGTFW